jgi:hypothetical protein
MFFLFKNNVVIGSTQAFKSKTFDDNTLSLGYIVSPSEQGKGYGTTMLKFVSNYLTDLKKTVVLGFRDGNTSSERIAVKCNFSYLMRTNILDALGRDRPMTFYKYNGTSTINEEYSVLPDAKGLITNQWINSGEKILSRVNPRKLTLDEYVLFSTSMHKPISLNETYYIFTSPHFRTSEELKRNNIRSNNFAITDQVSKKLFDPKVKGDIVLDKFCRLVNSDLHLTQINESKTSMILEGVFGEVKVSLVNDILFVEDFVI